MENQWRNLNSGMTSNNLHFSATLPASKIDSQGERGK